MTRTMRTLLGAALIATAAPAPADAGDIRIIVAMRDGGPVPAGTLAVAVEARDPGRTPPAQVRGRSTGAERTIAIALPGPAHAATEGRQDVVVRLERADGWLLARGSAPLDADGKVRVALDPVMY